MVNVELRLFSKMLYTGDFSPILQGDITAEDMTTEQGMILFNFVTNFRSETDGAARFPSLSIARSRFINSGIELPDPDPGETLEALVYETKTQKMRAKIQEMALELDMLAKSSEGLIEPLLKKQIEIRRMTDKLQRSKHISLAEGFEQVVADYDAGEIITDGIPWPWESIQKPTKGMHKGEFIIIAGRPKSRKTFTALSIAVFAFLTYHARVLIFSPEMKRRMMLLRTIAFICKLRYTEFKNSSLDQLEEMRLIEAARLYGKWPNEDDEQYAFRLRNSIPGLSEKAIPSINIVESTGRSVSWMESQIELYQPDIVIADSFYRQTPEGAKRNDTDWKVMSALSRNMKDLAMSTNVVLLGTHQLNREADNKIGSLSNLGYSDAFGQDMDLGFRVITGTIEGKPVSALVTLGGREFPYDGVLINNVPCCDFSEIAPITNKKTVANLLKQEEEAEAKEEAAETRKKTTLGRKVADQLAKTARAAEERLRLRNFGIEKEDDEKNEDKSRPFVVEGEQDAT